MSTATPRIEDGWRHATADIPARGLDCTRVASPAELEATAAALDIIRIERLELDYRISPRAGGRYLLAGTLVARVVQACVVTLDPVVAEIEDHIDVEFRPKAELPEAAEAEQEALTAAEHEPIEDHAIAVGRIVLETLAAALPAYPRAPGAALDQHQAGPAAPGAANPFAALAKWEPKPD